MMCSCVKHACCTCTFHCKQRQENKLTAASCTEKMQCVSLERTRAAGCNRALVLQLCVLRYRRSATRVAGLGRVEQTERKGGSRGQATRKAQPATYMAQGRAQQTNRKHADPMFKQWHRSPFHGSCSLVPKTHWTNPCRSVGNKGGVKNRPHGRVQTTSMTGRASALHQANRCWSSQAPIPLELPCQGRPFEKVTLKPPPDTLAPASCPSHANAAYPGSTSFQNEAPRPAVPGGQCLLRLMPAGPAPAAAARHPMYCTNRIALIFSQYAPALVEGMWPVEATPSTGVSKDGLRYKEQGSPQAADVATAGAGPAPTHGGAQATG